MPARRRTAGSRQRSRPRKPGHVSLGVGVALTRAEIQTLKDRAASDLRSVVAYTLWLVSEELSNPARRRRIGSVSGAGPKDQRTALHINLLMPREIRDHLLRRAEEELRSASSYVGRVIVEALASSAKRR